MSLGGLEIVAMDPSPEAENNSSRRQTDVHNLRGERSVGVLSPHSIQTCHFLRQVRENQIYSMRLSAERSSDWLAPAPSQNQDNEYTFNVKDIQAVL